MMTPTKDIVPGVMLSALERNCAVLELALRDLISAVRYAPQGGTKQQAAILHAETVLGLPSKG